jgi:hypothetical protein
MKVLDWCQPHWDLLREAIEARGLGPWISKGGEAAAKEFAREAQGGSDEHGFDPLMRAYGMISSRVTEMSGNIFDCPLCQVQSHVDTCTNPNCAVPKGAVDEMVGGCVDSLLEYAQVVGMVPKTPA